MSDNAILTSLRRMGFAKEEITGHGFRATARTLLDERLDIPPKVIEAQLALAVGDSLGRAYNRTEFLRQRRKMMSIWADYLDTLRRGTDAAVRGSSGRRRSASSAKTDRFDERKVRIVRSAAEPSRMVDRESKR